MLEQSILKPSGFSTEQQRIRIELSLREQEVSCQIDRNISWFRVLCFRDLDTRALRASSWKRKVDALVHSSIHGLALRLPVLGSSSTVAAASPSTRPPSVTLRALPRGRSAPSQAPLLRIQLGRRTRGAFFLPRCQKGADRHPEAEPGPEPELEQPDVMEIFSKDMEKAEADYISKLAKLGVYLPPEMFRKQKDEILGHLWKICHSKPDILPANTDGISMVVCNNALLALSLASMVMDMPSLGLGTNEISEQTVHQMVRTYAATFCKAAEDASQKRVQMDTICSFFGALGCLGAIAHMLVQDTVANLEDGRLKSKITHQLDTDYHQFRKKINFLSEEFKMDKPTQIMDKILLEGSVRARSYVSKLIKDASSLRQR